MSFVVHVQGLFITPTILIFHFRNCIVFSLSRSYKQVLQGCYLFYSLLIYRNRGLTATQVLVWMISRSCSVYKLLFALLSMEYLLFYLHICLQVANFRRSIYRILSEHSPWNDDLAVATLKLLTSAAHNQVLSLSFESLTLLKKHCSCAMIFLKVTALNASRPVRIHNVKDLGLYVTLCFSVLFLPLVFV